MKEVQARRGRFEKIAVSLIIVAIALAAGYLLAGYVVPTPKIGVIDIVTTVDGNLAELTAREIDYARHARDIKGVVLNINSPGGSASAGHDIYYQVRALREAKPVVASVDSLAASAAYQIAVGANEIYGKPASLIGNVGVIFSQPSPETLSERFITTGPFKSTGGSVTSYLQKLDLLYMDFRDSVMAERSAAPNPIKLSPNQLATGEIWVGLEAKQLGIMDELGSKLDAIDRAAQMAKLKNYQVVDVRDEYLDSLQVGRLATAVELYEQLDEQVEFDLSTRETEWPSFYQIYVPLE